MWYRWTLAVLLSACGSPVAASAIVDAGGDLGVCSDAADNDLGDVGASGPDVAVPVARGDSGKVPLGAEGGVRECGELPESWFAACTTHCGSVGLKRCEGGRFGPCQPIMELCGNGLDDDCDGEYDESCPLGPRP